MECIQAAGLKLGLNKDDCYLLTLQTMLGAAQLAQQGGSGEQGARRDAQVRDRGGPRNAAARRRRGPGRRWDMISARFP